MNIVKLSYKNIIAKPLQTFLTILILSLSIGLLLGVKQLNKVFESQLQQSLNGVDMVVGAKGSPLQLVLSAVLHIDNPTGNISYNEAKKIAQNKYIGSAIPIAIGDNYKGYKIVGTSVGFVDLHKTSIETGSMFNTTNEIVIGYAVSENLNLNIGDTLYSSHGMIENAVESHDEHPLKVVGILKPTQNVIDRLILTKLETIWHLHEHEDENDNHDHNHDDEDITALLIKFKNKRGLLFLPRNINENTPFQAALPKYQLDKLFQFTAIGTKAITWIALSILLVSGISMFVSLYRMVKERAKELALIRTYGASRNTLILLVFSEGLLVGVFSFFLGVLLATLGLQTIISLIKDTYKQQIYLLKYQNDILELLLFIFGIIIIATLIAIRPIFKMDISKIISHES
ncbi:FtsX-like permease family protein [Aureibaculum sp. 2210JD6-5]|uniref:ABC transporter permease n=1 Tax=Aureibaculum sp. 2210JD6-5 TaxID=3103957 RepID=UPI002AADC11B|nr:FtsX-like permease family protein [Aureibaculum sp. 2210JD6-5]MDY7395827.1 FtsX-like permease family protein [Aureibaculum sp. 2210JD6-5]